LNGSEEVNRLLTKVRDGYLDFLSCQLHSAFSSQPDFETGLAWENVFGEQNIMNIDSSTVSSVKNQLSQSTDLCPVSMFYVKTSCLTVISLGDVSEVENPNSIASTPNESSLSVLGYFEFDNQRYAILYALDAQKKQDSTLINLLTERELEVAALIASGQSNKQAAKQLLISEFTVSAHLRRIFIKLNVDNRTAMVYKCASLINQRM
jgi:DNA-binding CsgD family transcriptional regulator